MKKQRTGKFLKNIKKITFGLGVILMNWFYLGTCVLASAAQPKLVSGTIKLAQAATGWATALCAVTTGCIAAYHGIRWQAAGEDERPRYAKAVKTTLIIGVIITCIPGIATLILSYYK